MCSRKIGKQLNLLQLNVEGISRAKGEVIVRLLQENEVDVTVLQEIHCETPEELRKRTRIYGYIMVAAEFSRVYGRGRQTT